MKNPATCNPITLWNALVSVQHKVKFSSVTISYSASSHTHTHKLQALVYDILPSTTAIFSYTIGSRRLLANEQFFRWCSNSSKFVTNNSDKKKGVSYPYWVTPRVFSWGTLQQPQSLWLLERSPTEHTATTTCLLILFFADSIVVSRYCEPTNGLPTGCIRWQGAGSFTIKCRCNTDGCNTAGFVRPGIITAVISLLALVWLLR